MATVFFVIFFIIILISICIDSKSHVKSLTLTTSPKIDRNYFLNMTMHDLINRRCNNSHEYYLLYMNSIIPFTYNEQHRIKHIYNKLIHILPKKLLFPIAICKLATIENIPELSWPHTFDNCIMLPNIVLNKNNDELLHTIIHEIIHIYQRFNRDNMRVLYNDMGFIRLNDKLVPKLVPKLASNPDTMHIYKYIHTDQILLYTYDGDIDQHGNKLEFNCDLHQQGHPDEIIAECIARIISNNGYVRPDWFNMLNNFIYS